MADYGFGMAWEDSEGNLHDGDPPEGFIERDRKWYPKGDSRLAEAQDTTEPEPPSDTPSSPDKPWYKNAKIVIPAIIVAALAIRALAPQTPEQTYLDQLDKRVPRIAAVYENGSLSINDLRGGADSICTMARGSNNGASFTLKLAAGTLASEVDDSIDPEEVWNLADISIQWRCPDEWDRLQLDGASKN